MERLKWYMQTPNQERKGRNLARTEIRNGATSPQSRRRQLGYGKKRNGYRSHWQRRYERAARAKVQADWEMGRTLAQLEESEKRDSPKSRYLKIGSPNIKRGYWAEWARITLDRQKAKASVRWKVGQSLAIIEQNEGLTSPGKKKRQQKLDDEESRQGYEAQWAYHEACQSNLPKLGRGDLTKWRPAGNTPALRRNVLACASGIGATFVGAALVYAIFYNPSSPYKILQEPGIEIFPPNAARFIHIEEGPNGECTFDMSTAIFLRDSIITFVSYEKPATVYETIDNDLPLPDIKSSFVVDEPMVVTIPSDRLLSALATGGNFLTSDRAKFQCSYTSDIPEPGDPSFTLISGVGVDDLSQIQR